MSFYVRNNNEQIFRELKYRSKPVVLIINNRFKLTFTWNFFSTEISYSDQETDYCIILDIFIFIFVKLLIKFFHRYCVFYNEYF